MAYILASQNGNWSSTSTWTGGVVPQAGDTVSLNGKTITGNVDILIGGANNYLVSAGSFETNCYYVIESVGTTDFTLIGASANVVGNVFRATGPGTGTGTAKTRATILSFNAGRLNIDNGRSIYADLRSSSGAGSSLVDFNGSGASAAYIYADIIASSDGNFTVNNTSTGTLYVNANAIGSYGFTANSCIRNVSSGKIIVTGSYTGGATSVNSVAISNESTGIIEITCNTLTGGSVGPAIANKGNGTITGTVSQIIGGTGSAAIENRSGGSVTVTGEVIGGGSSTTGVGVLNSGSGSFTITGTSKGGNAAVGSSNTGTGTLSVTRAIGGNYGIGNVATNAAVGVFGANLGYVYVTEFEFGANGQSPTSGCVFLQFGALYQWRVFARPSPGGTPETLLNAAAVDGALPQEADVRNGVGYNYGNYTGTCHVPAATSVAAGVPVDNTVGTAVLTPGAVQAIVGAIVADAIDS